ncbi:reverse transcriptase [Phytophthora megakarya]|uniref:Reverse transcriptase n=1 Tax=Phytophthora megakarya TaxID=4795 RepID=A0A225VG68_9STRA|nr:reverse transcriptase [Phytophthora megakarya]
MEWQNLVLEATVDRRSVDSDPEAEDPPRSAVERPEYETPRGILLRPRPTAVKCLKGGSSGDQEDSDHQPMDNPPSDNPPLDCRPMDVVSVASDGSDLSSIADDMSHVVTVVEALDDQDPGVSGITAGDVPPVEDPAVETVLADEAVKPGTRHKLGDPLDQKNATFMSQKRGEDSAAVLEGQPNTSDLDLTWDSDQDYDECVYYHEGSDLYAEDVDGQLAVLPEVPATTENVKIEDIQLCGSDNQTPEVIDRLRQRIWKFRHLLIGKGNALPPAARGVVCDIDVGGARPIALKCRKLRIQFREILAELIKSLLSAKMITHSRSPWVSPIVVIIKKNGVDIRLCNDYRLVNSLTQLMVYPMPLIKDLMEDL